MSQKKISFDQSHDEDIKLEDTKIEGLSEYGKVLRSAGIAVTVIADSFQKNLKETSILVVGYPKGEFKPDELAAITEFVTEGGGLLLLAEWGNIGGNAFTLNTIAKEFGMTFRTDRVTDLVESYAEDIKIMGEVVGKKKIPQFIKISRFAPHPINEGVKEIIFVSGCSIEATPDNALAVSSDSSFGDKDIDGTWDPGEQVGKMAIATFAEHWAGRVVMVGDTSIFTNKYIGHSDNKKWALNVAKWLAQEI